MIRWFSALVMPAALAGCSGAGDERLPGNLQDTRPFAGIGEEEEIRLVGTEPFWGGSIADGVLTYSTPENQQGTRVAVSRFAGRGGISFSGESAGAKVDVAVTPAPCSDGMSDRTYPFSVTLQWGAEQRTGCAWSAEHPFEGSEAP